MAKRRNLSSRRRAAFGFAAAVLVHLAILALVLLTVHGGPSSDASPSIIVSLTPWIQRPVSTARIRPTPLNPHRTPQPTSPTPPSPIPPPPPKALEPDAPMDPKLAAQEAVSAALRANLGCIHLDDSRTDPAERERCLKIQRELGRGAPTYAVNEDDHARHDPLTASHGMAMKDHLSPRPGSPLSAPATCEHAWCENPDQHRGP